MFIVQRSIAICHSWWRFAQLILPDIALKAHPQMTNGN